MCTAIIEITWTGSKNRETFRCETPESLDAKIEQLQASPECIEFRVFKTTGKFVRQITWNPQP